MLLRVNSPRLLCSSTGVSPAPSHAAAQAAGQCMGAGWGWLGLAGFCFTLATFSNFWSGPGPSPPPPTVHLLITLHLPPFNLPVRHNPLIKPTPVLSGLAAFKPQLHAHSLPDCSQCLQQTLQRFSAWSPGFDPACLRLSCLNNLLEIPDHDPRLSLSGFCLSTPMAIQWLPDSALQSECYSHLLCGFLQLCDSDYSFTEEVRDWVSRTLLISVLIWFGRT